MSLALISIVTYVMVLSITVSQKSQKEGRAHQMLRTLGNGEVVRELKDL